MATNKVMLIKLSALATSAYNAQIITNAAIASTTIDDGSAVKALQGDLGMLVKGATNVGGICCDNSGNTYISDQTRHFIIKVNESGKVNIVAGVSGSSGNNTGLQKVAAADARFNTPKGICCDKSGNLYVADYGNNQIRKIAQDGYVSVFAGNGDRVAGLVDSTMNALQSRFSSPTAVAVDNAGVVYVCDTGNNAVRRVWGGNVLTIAGGVAGDNTNCRASNITGVNAIFTAPVGIAVDAKGNIFILDKGAGSALPKIKKITPNGWVYLHSGSGTPGRSLGTATTPTTPAKKAYTCSYGAWKDAGIAVDKYGYLFVVDCGYRGADGERLIKVDPTGVPANVCDFSEADTYYTKLSGVAVSPAQKVFLTITA